MKRAGVLRHRADRRSLAFAFFHAVLMGGVYALAPRGPVAWLLVPVIAFSAFLQLISTHNAMHSPMFVSRTANRAWQVILSLMYTYPASVMVPVHNLSHHLHLQTERDVLCTTDVRHRYNLFNLLHHVFTGTVHVHTLNAAYAVAMRKRRPTWFAQVRLEVGAVLTVATLLAWHDWRSFLSFVLLPSLLGESTIIGLGYLQHDGCDAKSEYDHSRNFTSPILNWLLFDNGYHTIHHMKPGLHWSLTRAAHATLVAPHIAPSLNERSILRYMFASFILPGGRRRHDGRPVTFEATSPPKRRALWVPTGAIAVGASSGAVEG